jgi:hypothetical protein
MTSSDERKCLKCEFSAPVSEWKVFPAGSCDNKLCSECRYRYCKVCHYDGRVRTWRYEEDGVSGMRCPSCVDGTFRNCSRCEFAGPLREWTIKPDGTPTKWCNRCLERSRTKPMLRSDEAIQARKDRNSVLVSCPDCNKEMQTASLRAHLKYKACKGVVVTPPVEHCGMAALLVHNGYATYID